MAPRTTSNEAATNRRRALSKVSSIAIDITLPRSKRPLTGWDLEDWRGQATPEGLSTKDAAYALGLRNTHHYVQMTFNRGALDFETELLLRIYLEFPGERAWARYSKIELFEALYGKALKPFARREDLVYARVDLRSRFTALFGRSGTRQYQWLEQQSSNRMRTDRSSDRVEAILSKLRNVPNAPEVLERTALLVHKLRGVDLDSYWPVPTLDQPPVRKKTGRRPKPKVEELVETVEELTKKIAPKRSSKAAASGVKARAGAKTASRKASAAA